MRILLTGSSGFVGKHLLRRLSGHEVYCLKRNAPLPGDFFDVVYHLAGEIYDESKMFAANVQLTYDLLRLNYKRFIYVGSSSEYGRKSRPIKETDSLQPETWYECTKAAASMLCRSKPVCIARPFSLYGPDDNPRKLVPTLIRAAQGDRKIKLCEAVHDYVYVQDFVDGLLMLAEDFQPGDVVNFGSGQQHTNHEIAAMIESLYGIKFEIEPSEPKPYDSLCWVCDPTYTRSRYGWTAKTTLEEGLRLC